MPRLLMVALLILALAAPLAAQPGKLPATKKLIEYGWDVPEPAFVRDHIAAMEKRPFDGLIMRVAGKGQGNILSGGKWDPQDYAADMAAMPAIKWGKFRHNFLMMYSASDQDWFSDKDWANVLSNVTIMAKCAKAGGCSLAFDAEPYGTNPWGYTGQKWAKEKSFTEYAAKARQRGRQFIAAIGEVIPDNVFLTFFTFSIFAGQMDLAGDPAKLEDALKQHGYGLYLPFLVGVLEGMGPKMTMTDGNEPSYYYVNSEAYYAAFNMMRQQALSLVPRELVAKHQTQAQVSQALYMDYVFDRVPWPNIPAKFMTPEEQAKWFEHNVYWALKTTDEYVWLYSEKMNWWTDKDIPAGMKEAIVRARDAIANHRGLGFDMRDRMKAIEDRRKAEIDTKLLRRTADVKAPNGPAPAIDGKLDDAAWQKATALEPFIGMYGTKPEDLKAKTRASVAYDAKALYISVCADEPLAGKMEIVGSGHDDAVWNGDSLDVFITAEASGSPYVHLILSPKNVQWDARYDTDNDMAFDPKWQSGTEVGKDFWAAEIAIPWAELRITPQAGMKLRANICRQRRAESELSCWSQQVSGFMESDHFGTWILR